MAFSRNALLVSLLGILLLMGCSGKNNSVSQPGGGGGGGGSNQAITLSQNVQPNITNPGTSQDVQFSVQASGVGLTYFWQATGGTFKSNNLSSVIWYSDQPGTYVITVNIRDSAGNFVTDKMTITVSGVPPPANHSPQIASPGITHDVRKPLIGETFTLTMSYSDPDPGDTLTVTWDDGNPNAGEITEQVDENGTSTVKWMTTETGAYTMTATVEDQRGGRATAIDPCPVTTVTDLNYVGANTCKTCHPAKFDEWEGTMHSESLQALANYGMDKGTACLTCHTVAWENGGFENTVATPDLGSVSCESCHGDGRDHFGDPAGINVSWDASLCGTCHTDDHHPTLDEWTESGHNFDAANGEGDRASCAKCHNGKYFVKIQIEGDYPPASNLPPEEVFNISCMTCHDPHSSASEGQLRSVAPATLPFDDVVVDGGAGNLCIMCHNGRRTKTDMENHLNNGSKYFGTHGNPQGAMLFANGGFEFTGVVYPSSTHKDVVGDTCVTCHMWTRPYEDENNIAITGHTYEPKVEACQQCHPTATDFDIGGVQTEIETLMTDLYNLLPKKADGVTIDTDIATTTIEQREAAWNYLFVERDGSEGVHNVEYARKLLRSSIDAIN